MNVANIKKFDVANGPGVRVSLFVSGCTHRCKGCFNAEAWDFAYGTPYTEKTEAELLEALGKQYIAGLSLLGGEPFEPCNQRQLLPFVRKVRALFPQKTVWCYTGYLFDTELQPGGRAYCEATEELLACIDVLVDGEFVEDKKDLKLRFRGSSNQRILDLFAMRAAGDGALRFWEGMERG